MSGEAPVRSARELGIIGCHICGLVCRANSLNPGEQGSEHVAGHGPEAVAICPRCGTTLHRRKPNSYARAWALLIAAAVLYLPANLLTMMHTSKLVEDRHDTIVSGVIALWHDGARDLAIIVFVASVVVPILKIGILALLLVTAQRGSTWRQADRARLYRIIEGIGHWSMLDVFVVVLLVTLVRLGFFGLVQAGPAALAFCAVVVLTMFASKSFDPRLTWDAQPPQENSR